MSELRRGTPFAASLDAAAAAQHDFDATAALQRFVTLEAIVDFDR